MFANNRDFCLRSNTNAFAVVFDEQVKQLRELFQLPRTYLAFQNHASS